jgi:uncharacterized lipoprotein YbaY
VKFLKESSESNVSEKISLPLSGEFSLIELSLAFTPAAVIAIVRMSRKRVKIFIFKHIL